MPESNWHERDLGHYWKATGTQTDSKLVSVEWTLIGVAEVSAMVTNC